MIHCVKICILKLKMTNPLGSYWRNLHGANAYVPVVGEMLLSDALLDLLLASDTLQPISLTQLSLSLSFPNRYILPAAKPGGSCMIEIAADNGEARRQEEYVSQPVSQVGLPKLPPRQHHHLSRRPLLQIRCYPLSQHMHRALQVPLCRRKVLIRGGGGQRRLGGRPKG